MDDQTDPESYSTSVPTSVPISSTTNTATTETDLSKPTDLVSVKSVIQDKVTTYTV